MTYGAKLAIRIAGSAAAKRFDAATRHPAEAQRTKLHAILHKNKHTEYGLEHGFESIHSLEEYERRVPVIGYEDIRARVERMAAGETNVLVAEKPLMFAQTSGTTGDPKLIPVTPTCTGRDHADQMRTWLYRAQQDHPGLATGKILSLVSPAVEGRTKAGIPFGATSGHMYQNVHWMIKRSFAVPYELFEIEDYTAKYIALLRLGIMENVTFLCTANPSSITKLCEFLDEKSEDLIRQVADGTLDRDLDVSPRIRSIIEGRIRPAPERAQALEAFRNKRSGRLLAADCWPRLALIACWKGGTVGAHVDRFPEWFDPDENHPIPVRDWGYLSSEARGSIPLSDDGCGGVLTVTSNVFEFVAVEDVEAHPDEWQEWTFLPIDALEESKEYHIILTTTGGLYRYDINDIVEVVGFHHRTPIIVFRRKGRGMTNLTGEKVSVNQIFEAIRAATEALDIQVEHFRAEADSKESRYVLKVEVAESLSRQGARDLLEAIEHRLCELNMEYSGKRKSLRLRAPVLELMKRGWYDAEKTADAKDGRRAFQAKTVILCEAEAEQDERDAAMVEESVSLEE